MKKKIIMGSIFVVFMLMLLPSSTALQLNTGLNGARLPGFEEIQNMDISELMDFIVEISKDYPLIQEEVVCQIDEMED
ncbi:MAG: hypothetical protein JSW60_01870, partial [Thermoplasmatales archaeon]